MYIKSCSMCCFFLTVDQIYHLASPASPPNYMYNPIKTLKTNTIGTLNMLGECTWSQLLKTRFEFIHLFFLGGWLFSNPCVCSKVWPSVWGPDCCWLLLQRSMEVRETLPYNFQVFSSLLINIEFSHQSCRGLMCFFGSMISAGVFLPLSELVTFT